MNDTTRRFLNAIVDRIPDGGRIVELRLFPAIRQAGMESGVAVVAVEPAAAPAEGHSADDGAAGEGGDRSAIDPREEAGVVSGIAGPSDEATPAADGDGGASIGASAAGHTLVASDGDVFGTVDEGADDEDGEDGEGDDAAHIAPDDREAERDLAYAVAAHELVDTDVAVEDEEGGDVDDVDATKPSIPHADAAADDEAVDEALDEKMQRIVLHATRDIMAAESRTLVPGPSPATTATRSVATLERTLDDSPYADAPASDDVTHRPIMAEAPIVADSAAGAAGVELVAAGVALDDPRVDDIRLDDILALPSLEGAGSPTASEAVAASPRVPIHRYAILTARYRLTLKGPDRGKWEVEITHEADAPLATLERVARGVAKRAGDESDPEHFSADSLRQALDAPAWVTTT